MDKSRRTLVELSHPIESGMVTYPGLPGPELSDHLTRAAAEQSYGAGVRFQIGRISMVANTGTYLDTPFHRFDDGADLATIPLERFADLEGVVARIAPGQRAVEVKDIESLEVSGRALLLHTGWDAHFGKAEYATNAPFLTSAAAEWLVARDVFLVGIDSVNIDDMADRSRPAHTKLLGAKISILEHLRGLEQLPRSGFRLHAAPAPVRGMGTFPVRAYAVVS